MNGKLHLDDPTAISALFNQSPGNKSVALVVYARHDHATIPPLLRQKRPTFFMYKEFSNKDTKYMFKINIQMFCYSSL